MKAIQYLVVAPEKIEAKEVRIDSVPEGFVLLKPLVTGICQSDIRYFFGRRKPEVLKKKYPLCLLHEGIAEVVEDGAGYKKGQRVIAIPNIPCHVHSSTTCSSCSAGNEENYCLNSKFMSSSCHGMAQTYFLQPAECIAHVPDDIPNDIAALTELLTVVYRAGIDTKATGSDRAIVLGCGPTGFLMAAILRHHFGIRKEDLYITDMHDEKLEPAKGFATCVNIKYQEIPQAHFEKAFECVGRRRSESAISQAFGALKPRSTLMLLGVSEDKIPIETRTILEKGLTVKGTTRSPGKDYPVVLEILRNRQLQESLRNILHADRFRGDSVEGLVKAFKRADSPNHIGKVLIEWG